MTNWLLFEGFDWNNMANDKVLFRYVERESETIKEDLSYNKVPWVFGVDLFRNSMKGW